MKTKNNMNNVGFIGLSALLLFVLLLVPQSFAALTMSDIQFDPAIVGAGDEVDIIIQYQEKGLSLDDKRIGNSDYEFKVSILPDDTLSKEFVTIVDGEGDSLYGSVYANQKFNRIFRIKIAQNAPPANYEFKLVGQWFNKGEPDSLEQFIRFTLPVKKEGITLDVASIQTQPRQIRAGDNFATVSLFVENSGEKSAKAIELTLTTPDGIVASYSDNNRAYIGQLIPSEQKEVTFTINVDELHPSGISNLFVHMSYLDIDNNNYQKQSTVPLLVKPRPNIEVINYTGLGEAGASGELIVTVQNIGEQSAEAVDVRIVKQHSQPFTIDIRSDYIGELEPGEIGIVKFQLEVDADASQKEHMLQLIIRAKGDTSEGDDTIYTFNRKAQYSVSGNHTPITFYLGVVLGIIIAIVLITKLFRGKK